MYSKFTDSANMEVWRRVFRVKTIDDGFLHHSEWTRRLGPSTLIGLGTGRISLSVGSLREIYAIFNKRTVVVVSITLLNI